jgi:Protein of unknown function (DUF3102)
MHRTPRLEIITEFLCKIYVRNGWQRRDGFGDARSPERACSTTRVWYLEANRSQFQSHRLRAPQGTEVESRNKAVFNTTTRTDVRGTTAFAGSQGPLARRLAGSARKPMAGKDIIDLSKVGRKHVKRIKGAFENAGRVTLVAAIQIGKALIAAQKDVPHGQWKPWLARHFPARSYRSLAVYMQIARAPKCAAAAHLRGVIARAVEARVARNTKEMSALREVELPAGPSQLTGLREFPAAMPPRTWLRDSAVQRDQPNNVHAVEQIRPPIATALPAPVLDVSPQAAPHEADHKVADADFEIVDHARLARARRVRDALLGFGTYSNCDAELVARLLVEENSDELSLVYQGVDLALRIRAKLNEARDAEVIEARRASA